MLHYFYLIAARINSNAEVSSQALGSSLAVSLVVIIHRPLCNPALSLSDRRGRQAAVPLGRTGHLHRQGVPVQQVRADPRGGHGLAAAVTVPGARLGRTE